MKNNNSFLVTFVVTLTLLTSLFVGFVLFTQTFTVSRKMHKLTKEAEYYLEYYSAEKQVEALAGVNARRAILLESDDNFTAIIANMPPFAKVGIIVSQTIFVLCMLILLWRTVKNNKEFFIFIAQLLTLTVIFVYSKLRRKPEVFAKYRRRSIVGRAKRALG